MPDLTTESFWRCDSILTIEVQGRSEKYTVTIQGWDAHCTCPSFRFRNECKHIKEVVQDLKLACRWNQMLDGGDVVWENGLPRCPNCGGPVVGFSAAV